MPLIEYDPKRFIAVVDGTPVIDPADAENAFEAGYTADRVKTVVGMYGTGSFEVMAATDGTFTIRVKGRSSDNTRFSAILAAQRQVPISFVNRNSGTEVAKTLAAMVQKVPSVTGGTTQSDKEWVFAAGEMQALPGGNLSI